MNGSDPPRRTLYLLTIWREERDEISVWHGFIETASKQRLYFGTLADLNQLLCELGGWMDPPIPTNPEAEPGDDQLA